MLGGVRGNTTNAFVFAFNTTFDSSTNGTRVGLIVTNPFDAPRKNMYEYSVSRNLSIDVKKGFKEQDVTLIPFSDFEVRSFKMHLIAKNDDDDDDDKGKSNTLIIIIIVLACLITVGFAIYIFVLVRNKKKNKNEERGSLLTDDRTDRQSI